MLKRWVSRCIGIKLEPAVRPLRFLQLYRQVPFLFFHSFSCSSDLDHSWRLARELVNLLCSCLLSLKWVERRRAFVIAAGDVRGSLGANPATLLCLRLLVIDSVVSFSFFTKRATLTLIFFCVFPNALGKTNTQTFIFRHSHTLTHLPAVLTCDAKFYLSVFIIQ